LEANKQEWGNVTSIFAQEYSAILQEFDVYFYFKVFSEVLPQAKTLLIRKKNSGASVRQRTIPTEQSPLVGRVSANFSG
jgi:hypothetical protein